MLNCLKNCGTELNIWKDAREPCYLRAVSWTPLVLPSWAKESDLTQSERGLLTYYLGFLVKVRSVYSYLLRLLFKDREEYRVLEAVRGQQLR